MKRVEIKLVFHIDETTEEGKEYIKEIENSSISDFVDEEESHFCKAAEVSHNITDL